MKYLFFILLLFVTSCQDNKKEQLLHLVKEWQGKEIRFPDAYSG